MKKIGALLLALALLTGCTARNEPKNRFAFEETPTLPPAPVESTNDTEPNKNSPVTGCVLAYIPDEGVNPFTCTSTLNRALISLLYEPLFVVNSNFQPEPLLCESFVVSTDMSSYTFRLFPGVTFSDGSPLTAEDVVNSISAARNSRNYKGRLSHISYSTSLDDLTVEVNLDTPYENFAQLLDIPIVKSSSIDDAYPIGTGPYSFTPEALVRNNNWWQNQPPVIDLPAITLMQCADSFTLRDEFQYGAVDAVYCDPTLPANSGYRSDFEIWEVPSTTMGYVGFNYGSGFFANTELRRAVTHAIDRSTIVTDYYRGYAMPATLPCSPRSDYYDVALSENYQYNLDKLQEAVSASGVRNDSEYAGYTGIFLVCNEEPNRVKVAELIAKTLNEAGLSIVVSAVDYETFSINLNEGNYDLYLTETRLTANFDLTPFFSEYGSLEVGYMKNENLYALSKSTFSNTANYYELFKQVMNYGAFCPIYFKNYVVFSTRGLLTNLDPGMDFAFRAKGSGRSLSDADKTYEEQEAADDGE